MLYRKVFDQLCADIRDGRLPVGAPLPSEQRLCERFGVSRITVRRALDGLAQDGLIDRGAGRVARVVAPRFVQTIVALEDPFNAMRLVRGTSVRLLSFEWRIAEGAAARALQLDDGDQMLHFQRLREQDGAPVYHSEAFLPAPVGALVNRKALTGAPMHEVLAAAGIVPDAVDRQMRATPCPKPLAPLLGLKQGAPTFRLERISRDGQGRPLHLLIGHWRWDRFSMRLSSTSSVQGGLLTIDAPQPGDMAQVSSTLKG